MFRPPLRQPQQLRLRPPRLRQPRRRDRRHGRERGFGYPLSTEQSTSKSDSTTYAISKSLHRSVEPAGRVRRIAAAVLVDDAVECTEQAGKRTSTRRKRTADEMKEIEQLARAAIGVDAQRGDVLAVENLSFQEMPLETPPPPTKTEHWRAAARALDVDVALRRAGGAVRGGLFPDSAAGEEAGA